jgi:hypothetical protein
MLEYAATFDDASFDDAARDEDTVRRGFWMKVRRFGAGLPFAEDCSPPITAPSTATRRSR